MNDVRKKFNECTKDMTLQEKLEWVKNKLFYIEIDNYIQDKDTWREYLKLKEELKEKIAHDN